MSPQKMFLAGSCLALNLSLAKAAAVLALPVYLDSVGTILAAALLPGPFAIGVAVATSLLGGLIVSPYFAAYVGTQIAISLVALLAYRWNLLRTWWKALLAGFMMAACATLLSAPITVILFGGVTLSGTTAINAVLIGAGQGIWKSVVTGSLFVEAIDKPAAALLAWVTLTRLPKTLQLRAPIQQ